MERSRTVVPAVATLLALSRFGCGCTPQQCQVSRATTDGIRTCWWQLSMHSTHTVASLSILLDASKHVYSCTERSDAVSVICTRTLLVQLQRKLQQHTATQHSQAHAHTYAATHHSWCWLCNETTAFLVDASLLAATVVSFHHLLDAQPHPWP